MLARGGTGPYTFSLITGGAATLNEAVGIPLPAGLTLSSAGLISGTPTGTGWYSPLRIRIQDSAGASLVTALSLAVNSTSTSTLNIYSSTANQDDAPVGIGHYLYLGASAMSGSLTSPVTWSVISGSAPPGMNWVDSSPTAKFLIGQPSTPGLYNFVVRATDAAGNFGQRAFTVRVSPINVLGPVNSNQLPEARVASSYSNQLVAVGGTPPYYFSWLPNATATPPVPGLTLSSSGLLGGTPTAPGNYVVAFQVTDATGAAFITKRALRVIGPAQVSPLMGLSYWVAYDFDPAVGQSYQLRLNRMIQGGVPPYTWTISEGTLPPGLQIVAAPEPAGAHIVGIPTTPGAYTFGLRVTDSAGQTYVWPMGTQGPQTTIGTVRLGPDVLPSGTAGTPYSVPITTAGGVAPVTVTLSPWCDLPAGLSLSGGVLSGTPTTAGTYKILFNVLDSAPGATTRTVGYYMVVDSLTPSVPSITANPAVLNINYQLGPPPPTTPVNIASTGGAMSFTAAVTGITGASLSATTGSTPRVSNLQLTAGMAAGSYVGLVTVAPPVNSPAFPVAVPVYLTVTPAAACAYVVSPTSAAISAAGGSGSLAITTAAWCGWTATASAPLDRVHVGHQRHRQWHRHLLRGREPRLRPARRHCNGDGSVTGCLPVRNRLLVLH